MATVDNALQQRMDESHRRIMSVFTSRNIPLTSDVDRQIKQELFLLVMITDSLLVAAMQANQEANHAK